MPSVLWLSAGMPGIFMLTVFSLFGANPLQSGWFAILITLAQIAIGLWLIRVGPRPAITYLLFLMLSSLMGSLIFDALVRV